MPSPSRAPLPSNVDSLDEAAPDAVDCAPRRRFRGPDRHDIPVEPIPSGFRCCMACGRAVASASTARGGRPRDYCSDEHRQWFNQVLTGVIALHRLQEEATPAGWMALRSRFWMALNARPWNRGVPRGPRGAR